MQEQLSKNRMIIEKLGGKDSGYQGFVHSSNKASKTVTKMYNKKGIYYITQNSLREDLPVAMLFLVRFFISLFSLWKFEKI